MKVNCLLLFLGILRTGRSTPTSPAPACDAGSYAIVHPKDSTYWLCIFCPNGKMDSRAELITRTDGSTSYVINSTISSTTCQDCPAGKYSAEGRPCEGCLKGSYLDLNHSIATEQRQCASCPSGSYTEEDDATECKKCELGWSTDGYPGETASFPCPMHTYRNDPTQDKCSACPYSTMDPRAVWSTSSNSYTKPTDYSIFYPGEKGVGNQECVACPHGSYSSSDNGDSFCRSCGKGRYINMTETIKQQSMTCKDCPINTYSGEWGIESAAECLSCPLWQDTQRKEGREECTSCLPYQTRAPTDTQCTWCPDGMYTTNSMFNSVITGNGTECLSCPAGQFAIRNMNAPAKCQGCMAGGYHAGGVLCKPCGSSTYAPRGDEGFCIECPAGNEHSNTASSQVNDCKPCKPNMYRGNFPSYSVSPKDFRPVCSPCDPNERVVADLVCSTCPVGQFHPTGLGTNTTLCAGCPPGSTMDDYASAMAGKLVCESCKTSTYDELLKNMKVKNVTCDAEKVTVNFNDEFYQSPCLGGRTFTVGTPNVKSCPQQRIEANAAIEYEFDDCLVEKTSNSTDLTFNLDFELETSTSGASVPGLVLNGGGRTSKWSVSCTYDRVSGVENNDAMMNFSVSVSPPVVEEFVVDVAQEFTIQMETFSSSNYSAALSYPIVKNYQDNLYFQISFDDTNPTAAVGSRALSSSKTVGQADNFHLIIESCWATPDINDISTNNVTLIENECVSSAVSSIVEINSRVNNTNVDQWTSRVFTFPDEPAVVIKCQVRICYEKADCVRDCQSARAGRFLGGKSVQNGKTLERTVSTGTISIRNEAENENGDDTLDDDESAGMATGYAFFVIMICFSFM